MDTDDEEVALRGGRITSGVVRVGDSVRRPVGEHSAYVHRLLDHLHAAGVSYVPRYLGQDARGREILSFQPGMVPPPLPRGAWTKTQARTAATMLREIHDATAGTSLAAGLPVVCHNDFGPHNLVFDVEEGTTARSRPGVVGGLPLGVIDFDQAAPGEREDDVAYAAWLWLLGPETEEHLDHQLHVLEAFVDAYGSSALDLRGFGARAAARVDRERLMHERAGRPSAPGSWLRRQITWLEQTAGRLDRWAAAL